jgi:hypothetical protein
MNRRGTGREIFFNLLVRIRRTVLVVLMNSGVGQVSCAASLCDNPIVKSSKKLKETMSNCS